MTVGTVSSPEVSQCTDDSAVLQALKELEREPPESFFEALVTRLAQLLAVDTVVAVEILEPPPFRRILAVSHEGRLSSPFPISKPESASHEDLAAMAHGENARAHLKPEHPLIRYFDAESVVAVQLRSHAGKLLGWLAACRSRPMDDLDRRWSVLEVFGGRATAALEYRRMSLTLRKAKGRYRRFFEDSLAGAFVTKPDGEIVACNAAFAEMLGYPSAEALRRINAFELYWDTKDRTAYLDRLRRDGKVRSSDVRLRRGDGTSLFASTSVRGSFDANGEITEITGFLLDQTERKRAQERVIEQLALLNRTDDAILVCSVEGTPIYWNFGAEELLGVAASDAGSLGLEDLFGDIEGLDLESLWSTVLDSGEWHGELRRPVEEGRVQIVKSRWSLLRDDSGQPTSVLMIGADVTESRALESAVLRTQRMESLGTLAGGIAHDLNNVLAPIQLSLQLLKPKLPSADDQHLLSILGSAAKRATEMVRQVLWFARGIEGKRFPVSLAPLLEELHRIFTETMPRSIEVSTEYERDVPAVLGDATQIFQVLMNLCLNARDSMPSGGQLRMRLASCDVSEHQARSHPGAQAGRHVVLEVADTGCGIPADMLELIFDPFFSTKEERSGTGLGLTTAYSIVKSHGGFIEVRSHPGQGTAIRVYLPPVEQASESGELPEAAADSPEHSQRTILLVDDNISFLKVASKVLKKAGHAVLIAEGGVEALDLFAEKSQTIDAVLCDQEMAHLDGTSTLRLMRRMNPKVRIAMVSGLPEFKPAVDSIVVIKKPCTAETLLSALTRLFTEPPSVPSALPEWEG